MNGSINQKHRCASVFRTLVVGLFGGITACIFVVTLLLIAGNPFYESGTKEYMNPSAAVGESMTTLIRAVAVFAAGACLSVLCE